MTRSRAGDHDLATLRAARRVLVTGGPGLSAETAARACDLAEAVEAAVDFGGAETARTTGPTIARIGAITADPLELRDRADLVVVWFCDPAAGSLGDLVTKTTSTGTPRHVIAVGVHDTVTDAAVRRFFPLPDGCAVDLARLLHARATGHALPAPQRPLLDARDALAAAIEAADCVAFVTSHRDAVGLAAWSLAGLVRAVSGRRAAFEVPLDPAVPAATVCTWRYGAAGAIARADRRGAAFLPAECDAVRLVSRGDVDCVVAVGGLGESLETALAARGDAVTVIRVSADDAEARARLKTLHAAFTAAGAGDPS